MIYVKTNVESIAGGCSLSHHKSHILYFYVNGSNIFITVHKIIL